MYFYIISCQANILFTVSITKHIECVNLIIFRNLYKQKLQFCLQDLLKYSSTKLGPIEQNSSMLYTNSPWVCANKFWSGMSKMPETWCKKYHLFIYKNLNMS